MKKLFLALSAMFFFTAIYAEDGSSSPAKKTLTQKSLIQLKISSAIVEDDDTYCTAGSQTVNTGTGTVTRRCVACSGVSMADAIHLVDVCLNGRQQ